MQHVPVLAPSGSTFNLQIAPEDAVAHPGWQRAQAAALAAVRGGAAAVLLGQPGSGKTLLLKDLARTLRREDRAVRLVERGDAVERLVEAGTILLVDEAGRMGAETLAALCAGPAPFVLAALPGFQGRLSGLPRPITPVTLGPLAPEDVARFVAARLAAAGQPRDLVEPEAVLALARHSGGLPRMINVIGGAAMFLARLEGAPRVGVPHVAEAASMRDGVEDGGPPPGPGPVEPAASPASPVAEAPMVPPAAPPRRRALLGAAASGFGVVAAGAWLLRGQPAVPPPVADAAQTPPAGTPPVAQARTDIPAAAAPPADQPAVARPDEAAAAPEQRSVASPPQRRAAPPSSGAAEPRPEPSPVGPAPVGPAPVGPAPVGAAVAFQGPIYNETMGQGGWVRIVVRKQAQPGAVTARFDASAGLLGSGEMAGRLSDSGQLSASGLLMVGRNTFNCDLRGIISGGMLTGSASFVRVGGTSVSRSSFAIPRA